MLDKFDVKLVVYSQDEETEEPSREHEQELMSLITVFVAKNNEKWAAENGRWRKREAEQEEEEEPKGKNPSNKAPAGKAIR